MTHELCSCGDLEPHTIAKRTTADEIPLEIWSDGTVTRRGFYLRGLGDARSKWGRDTRARAVRLMLDDLSLFDADEIPELLKLAASSYRYTYSSDIERRAHVFAMFDRRSQTGRHRIETLRRASTYARHGCLATEGESDGREHRHHHHDDHGRSHVARRRPP